VGKLALPEVQPLPSSGGGDVEQRNKEVRTQTQDLLARLKEGSTNRTRVTLNPRQLQRVHSLVL
jgi:hypothetical protein